MLMIDRIHRSSQCSAKLNDLGGVNVLHTMFPSCSDSSVLPHTPLLKHSRGDMYETGNQKDRNPKCIVLRDPRRQRSRNEARSMAQCAECTGCRDCIRSAVPRHCPRCRTRRINLIIVAEKSHHAIVHDAIFIVFTYFSLCQSSSTE